MLLIAAYVQPLHKRELLDALDIAVRQALESLAFSAVVVGGDLNATEEELRALMPITQIMFTRTPWNGSRKDANGNWSKLDYVCSTALMSAAYRLDHLSQSDHAPIGCCVIAPHTIAPKKAVWRVDKRTTPKELALTLHESAWPLK